MVWMTVARMDKGAMRGTNQAGQVALQLLRVVSLLSTGVLRPLDDGVPLQLVAIVTCGILGAVIGDQLHGSVSDAVVVRIILVLVSPPPPRAPASTLAESVLLGVDLF